MQKLSLLFFSVLCIGTTYCQETQKKTIKTIIIDPGHGGIDPGARGLFSSEAQVSLSVGLKLGKAIEEQFPDIKILYTRTKDVLAGNQSNKDLANRWRAQFANDSGGNLFIAIHCNFAGKKPGGWYDKRVIGYEKKTRLVRKGKKKIKQTYNAPVYETYWKENDVRGTETYVWAVSKNEAKINSMAENVNFYGEEDSTSTIKLPDPKDPVEAARMLVYSKNYFSKSLLMADLVQKQFAASGRGDRGVKQRNEKGIWVLQATGMPSILIEIGFISNKEEEQYINSEEGQSQIVENIISALKEYKQALDAKTSLLPLSKTPKAIQPPVKTNQAEGLRIIN
jgi:N-acetylmuramoyl-L-alanine amidase